MGVMKYFGKLVGIAVIGSAIYTTGVLTSDSARNAAFYAMHPQAQIEAGYCNIDDWHGEKVINPRGNIEAFFVNEKGYGLPCLEGQISMQLGNDGYVIENLRRETKPAAIANGYNSLPEEQRLEVVVENYDKLSPKNQDALADELMSKNYQNKWEQFKRTMRDWWNGIVNQEV